MSKLKNSNCEKIELGQNSYCDKTQIVTKLKLWQNLKLKFWQNSQTQNVTKLKNSIMIKLEAWQFSIYETL